MRNLAFGILAFSVALTALPIPGVAGEGCTCRATDGSKIAEGATACIKSPKGMVMAKCERELNNTSWTFLNTPCPSANMSRAVSPLVLLKG